MKKDLLTELSVAEKHATGFTRRSFLGLAGGLVAAGILLDSCRTDESVTPTTPNDTGVNLGSGDIGILNYAYALEQLESAFYTRVMESIFSGMTSTEKALLTDIRDHEVAHREFFKAALGANAIGALEADFSSVDFGSRDSVLATAKTFEDLGVSAYNGAGKLLVSGDYLLLAGKIVSVEARHAAYIRDLISPGSFADSSVVDGNGLDMARMPSDVLSMAAPFIKTKINASNLPTE